MKNKLSNLILIIVILLLCTFIVFFSINYLDTDKKVVKSGKETIQSSSNSLALMLETAAASGEYQVSIDSTWPATGYEFNPILSKCENGSILTYDIVTKKVKVQSNRSDKCFVYFDKEYVEPVINSITESNVSGNSFTLTVNATAGTSAIKTYHFSKDNGASYVTSSSNSYTFNGLSEGTAYNVKVKVEDTGSIYSEISSKTVTTKRLTIAEACVGQNFAQCMKNNYQKDGMDFHTSTLASGANDGSYRFSGANPNNYVCFGPGATAVGQTCPDNNLYRIIGVFGNQIKLIKKTSVGNKQWDNKGEYGDNRWSSSLINSYLNGEYLNSLTTTWSNKIASNTWQVGGMLLKNGIEVPLSAYTFELGSKKDNTTFNGKIGLMYVSDYGFAASPGGWSTVLSSYIIQCSNNWLFAGSIHSYEWTMTRHLDSTRGVFIIDDTGNMIDGRADRSWAVRPSFSLESSINLIGGNGTPTEPYRV